MNKRYQKSCQMLERAIQSIPLGSQTFSKSITQYPKGYAPLYIERGLGSKVWDIDGNEYIDFVNGLASVLIGYNNDIVNAAVKLQFKNGVIFSLPHPLEIEVAELLIEQIPCAEMVRFGKNGTDATSAAIRLARAFTGKEHVLICGYHGWQDWYIGTTARGIGIPESIKKLSHTFQYNNIESLNECFKKLEGNVAAVIMEPMNIAWPDEIFLEEVKRITEANDAILVFDETITGFRFDKGGAQKLFGVTPHLATFGKGMANGYPLSAIVGRKDIMMFMEKIFYSGTFGGETLSLASAKAVMNMINEKGVVKKINDLGVQILEGVEKLIVKHKLEKKISISGHPSWSFLNILDVSPYNLYEIKTYILQELFLKGILSIGTHNISYSHTEEDVVRLLEVYDELFEKVQGVLVNKNLEKVLQATSLQPLFKVR